MNSRPIGCIVGLVLLVLASAMSVSGAQTQPPGFPANIQLGGVVQGETAIGALGNRLPEVAAFYRKSPEELRALFRSDHSLKADPHGRLYYVCDAPAGANASDLGGIIEAITPIDNPPFSTNETFLLHSRPGANRVIYLDFDGHEDNTPGRWEDGAASTPFDLDGDTNSFNATERNRIVHIWQRVAEDFSMYDIDVTTEEPGIEALRKTSTGDQTYGVRVAIGGSSCDWLGCGAGGVAFVGSFDDNQDTPCWVFPKSLGNSEKNIAEAASHEAGHTLGLSHDGTTTGSSYYSGQGNWAPIMGVGYSKPIVQWSKGEYTNANQLQDDLAVMLNNGALYRVDDHGNSIVAATGLSASGSSASTIGVIERNTDRDFFRFTAGGGLVTITVARAPRDSNLRMQVVLYDGGGTPVLTNTPADSSTSGTQSSVSTLSLAAGDYFVSVDGAGNGNPLTTGYTDYSSLGQYTVIVSGTAPPGPLWLPTVAGTYSWTNVPNWSPSPPNGVGLTASVNNNIVGNQTINLPTAITLGTLNLGDANDTHPFAIRPAGGSLTFNNGASPANLNKYAGLDDDVAVPMTLASNLTINHFSIGTLTLSGAIGGAGSLAKDGTATTALAGTNSYSGSTTIKDGVVRLDNTNALPAGNLLISGGVLGLASGDFMDRTVGTNTSQVQWTDDGGFAAYGAPRQVRFSTNSLNWTFPKFIGNGNTLILGANDADATLQWLQDINFAGGARTIQVNDGAADIDASISGNMIGGAATNYVARFIKTGGGTLALTSQPTYWGDTTVSDGTLMLGDGTSDSGGVSQNSANIAVSAGAILAVNRPGPLTQGDNALRVAISGEGGFAQVGSGTTVFTLTNNYVGPTTISAGTLEIGGGGWLGSNGTYAGTISIATGATFEKSGGGSQTLSGAVTGGGTLKMSGSGGLILTSSGNGYGALEITAGRVFIGASAAALPAAATVSITNGGLLVFNTSGTYGNAITIGDTGGICSRNALGATLSNVTLPGTGTVIFNNDDATTKTLTITSGQTLTSNLTVRISGGRMSASTAELGAVTLGGVLSGSGGLTLECSGNPANVNGLYRSGKLILTGANDFSGGVTIKNGTLESKTTTTTLGTGTVAMGGAGSSGATFITGQGNTNAFTINAPDSGTNIIGANGAGSGFVMSGPVTLNGDLMVQSYFSSSLQSATARPTLSGGITGTGNLILNNLSGGTNTITLGVNPINHTGSIMAQGGSVGSNVISAVIGANVTGVTQNSATCPLILSATNTYTSPTTVNAGKLVMKVASLAASSTVSVAANAVLQLDFTTTNVVAGFITNGVSLPAGVYNAATVAPFISGSGSLLVGVAGPSGPAMLTNSYSGGVLTLSWPAGEGWRLQQQNNALSKGLFTNWVFVTDSSVSSTNITVDKTKPTMFYRLVYP